MYTSKSMNIRRTKELSPSSSYKEVNGERNSNATPMKINTRELILRFVSLLFMYYALNTTTSSIEIHLCVFSVFFIIWVFASRTGTRCRIRHCHRHSIFLACRFKMKQSHQICEVFSTKVKCTYVRLIQQFNYSALFCHRTFFFFASFVFHFKIIIRIPFLIISHYFSLLKIIRQSLSLSLSLSPLKSQRATIFSVNASFLNAYRCFLAADSVALATEVTMPLRRTHSDELLLFE